MYSLLVTGAKGQLGSEIHSIQAEFPDLKFTFTDIEDLDISDSRATVKFFRENQFDHCINCAAYTNVDKAEQEVVLAKRINVEGAEILGRACLETGTRMIHISTDYIYKHTQNWPIPENCPTGPKGVYAQTKLASEKVIRELMREAMIIRTSWLYSNFGNNFVKTMLRLGSTKDQVSVVYDQVGSPTYARDLAHAILTILSNVAKEPNLKEALCGSFNYSNEGVCSWYDFAKAIFRIKKVNCQVIPVDSSSFPSPVVRPPYSVLDKSKFKKTFNINIPYWEESLADCLLKIK